MNWWPWQSTPLPSRTSANAAAPVGATRDPYLSAPIDDMTLLAAYGNRAVAAEIANGGRRPGPGDIEFYRNRARSAEAEANRLRSALLEIVCAPLPPDDGDRSEWKAALFIAGGIASRAVNPQAWRSVNVTKPNDFDDHDFVNILRALAIAIIRADGDRDESNHSDLSVGQTLALRDAILRAATKLEATCG